MSESRKERWEEYFFPIETIEAVQSHLLNALLCKYKILPLEV